MTTLQSVQALLKANFELAPETLQPEAKLLISPSIRWP